MSVLELDTARTAAAAWVAAGAPWDDDQQREVASRLVQIGGYVTPHVARDVPISDADLQEFVLSRTLSRLDDWLVRAATTLRVGYGLSTPRLTEKGTLGIGLRSATDAEIDALPGMGPVGVSRLGRFLAEHVDTVDMLDLLEVDGMSEARVRQLQENAYLERPRTGLLSRTVWAFLCDPTVETLLDLLARSDMFVWFGDHNSAARRVAAASEEPYDRFVSFLAMVEEQAERTSSVADAVTSSEAVAWLRRHRLHDHVLADMAPADGEVVIDGAYVSTVKAALDGAQSSIEVLMFLGTSAAGTPESPGPLVLVDALVAATNRGVAVRVVLDQDDGGEPYRSLFINRALVRRLQGSGIHVRLDDPRTLLHSKTVLVDDVTTVVGSHNWTARALSGTHEASVLVQSPALAERAKERFEQLWVTLPDLPPVP